MGVCQQHCFDDHILWEGRESISHTHNHNTITTLPFNNDQMCLVEYEGLFYIHVFFPRDQRHCIHFAAAIHWSNEVSCGFTYTIVTCLHKQYLFTFPLRSRHRHSLIPTFIVSFPGCLGMRLPYVIHNKGMCCVVYYYQPLASLPHTFIIVERVAVLVDRIVRQVHEALVL